MVGNALGHIEAEGDEHLGLDMDGAGEVDVVLIQPVRDRGQDQDTALCPPARLQTDRLGEEQVDVDRQMPAMLLGRSGWQNHDRLPGDGVVHLGPGQPVVAIFPGLVVFGSARRHLSPPFPFRAIAPACHTLVSVQRIFTGTGRQNKGSSMTCHAEVG